MTLNIAVAPASFYYKRRCRSLPLQMSVLYLACANNLTTWDSFSAFQLANK